MPLRAVPSAQKPSATNSISSRENVQNVAPEVLETDFFVPVDTRGAAAVDELVKNGIEALTGAIVPTSRGSSCRLNTAARR